MKKSALSIGRLVAALAVAMEVSAQRRVLLRRSNCVQEASSQLPKRSTRLRSSPRTRSSESVSAMPQKNTTILCSLGGLGEQPNPPRQFPLELPCTSSADSTGGQPPSDDPAYLLSHLPPAQVRVDRAKLNPHRGRPISPEGISEKTRLFGRFAAIKIYQWASSANASPAH